eukprot:g18840.t1
MSCTRSETSRTLAPWRQHTILESHSQPQKHQSVPLTIKSPTTIAHLDFTPPCSIAEPVVVPQAWLLLVLPPERLSCPKSIQLLGNRVRELELELDELRIIRE